MADRLYRAYSPSRNQASRVAYSRDDARGMMAAANQGAVAFGKPADYRLQVTPTDWQDEEGHRED